MSGKPQFDEVAVIAAAIEVFWRSGYAAAAVSDLTEATGLSRSSRLCRGIAGRGWNATNP